MSEPERVDPTGIPEFTGDLGQLETAHAALTDDAGAIRDIGGDIHSRFQGLSAFYDAPEAEQLFASTTPVRDRADTFATDLESVASSLSSYADEVRPLVQRLRSLKADAEAFVAEIQDDDDWQYDGGKVERNNQLVSDISTTVAEFWAAERRCANAITALVGGTQWTVDDGSGGENMYGMSVEDMSQAGETPWGKAVEEKHHWYEIGHHLKSFVWDGIIVDGIWGTITGLGTLLNPWSDNFGAAWKGLGQLATGLAILGTPILGPAVLAGSRLLPEDNPVRGWIDDSMSTTVTVGKSLIAWDEWSENPARAAGLVTFNVVTTVATLGTGTAVRGTGAAASATTRAVTAAARVGNLIDPMAHIGRVAGAGINGLRNIANLTSDLANITHTLPATAFPDGTLRLPDGTVIPETGPLPDLPPGTQAITLPDNTVRLPDGSILHPSGQLDLPSGQTVQTPDQLPPDIVDTPVRDPELATVGGRDTPPVMAQAGDNLPTGSYTNGGDLPPGGLNHDLPPTTGGGSGGTTELPPGAGGTDNAVGGNGGSSGGDGPGTGGLGDEGGSGDWDLPANRDPDDIVREQVELANKDKRWFERYYRSNGYRRSTTVLDENLNPLPQLTWDSNTGQWIAASDVPPPTPPRYLGDDVPGYRHSATPEQLARLDEAADSRAAAISHDQLAEQRLNEAEVRYSENSTPENHQAMLDAEAAHRPAHTEMGRASETFGEAVAAQAIAEHYPDARLVETNGPANGTAQFDQIYRRADGSFLVVEAKSQHTTPLGSRRLGGGRVSQGTREYFEDILSAMRARAATDPDSAALANELSQALKDNKVDYILVQGRPDGAAYGGYTMKHFDLSKSES